MKANSFDHAEVVRTRMFGLNIKLPSFDPYLLFCFVTNSCLQPYDVVSGPMALSYRNIAPLSFWGLLPACQCAFVEVVSNLIVLLFSSSFQ